MKYLKKYETWPDYIHFYGLKKYAILKGEDYYTAIELVKSTDDFSIIVQTLAFGKRSNEIKKGAEIPINDSIIRSRIIFQSDDIEEIRTQLELLRNTLKYNL